jgi:hypothetical protein
MSVCVCVCMLGINLNSPRTIEARSSLDIANGTVLAKKHSGKYIGMRTKQVEIHNNNNDVPYLERFANIYYS